MAKKKRAASPTSRDAAEKIVTRHPSRRFHRLLGTASQCGNAGSINLEVAVKLRGQTFDKSRVGCARTATQPMVEMADNEPPITQLDEPMKQRDRIPATGHANEVPLIGRKLLEYS
jgi:hypothetical protein